MSVEQHDVVVERIYAHPPATVFAAWADPDIKRSWFDLTRDREGSWRSECRENGIERYASPSGVEPSVTYNAVHQDVVHGERIVLTSQIRINGEPSSFALTTAEFLDYAGGTQLRITEHLVYLDGMEQAETRRQGVEAQLGRLAEILR